MAAHKFSELQNKMSPERRVRITQRVQKTLAEMRIAEQRESGRQADETPPGAMIVQEHTAV